MKMWRGILGEEKYRPKYPDSPFIHIADLVNKETGKTYREENTEKTHHIKVGSLVEIIDSGVRMFVAKCGRDCDMTPLYWLSPHTSEDEEGNKFANMKWIGGYPEEALVVIRANESAISVVDGKDAK